MCPSVLVHPRLFVSLYFLIGRCCLLPTSPLGTTYHSLHLLRISVLDSTLLITLYSSTLTLPFLHVITCLHPNPPHTQTGVTSLPQAITKGHEEIALILIEAGADVASKNKVSHHLALSCITLSYHMLPNITLSRHVLPYLIPPFCKLHNIFITSSSAYLLSSWLSN